MKKRWICDTCGYIYDPDSGDASFDVDPGTSFEDLPEKWLCPLCAASINNFDIME